MEAVKDVMNQIVRQAPDTNPTNVFHMEVENVVMNRIVIQAP
jgi:hypothetical protein